MIESLLRTTRAIPLPLAWWLGGLLGEAAAHLPMRDVKRCRAHLAKAFPTRDAAWVDRTTRACFRHFGATALWTIASLRRTVPELRRGLALEGRDNIRDLWAAGRRGEGTVVYTGHLGNWELLSRTFASVIPSCVIGRKLRSPVADAIVRGMRAQGGATIIDQDDDVRIIVRHLRAGMTVATLADQDIPHLNGVFCPWFGHQAWTPSAPAALALLARAAVMPVFLLRRHGRWVVHAGPRVRFPKGASRDDDIQAITAWATAYQERLVAGTPHQWVWWHKRWRTRPAGEAS